jgi:hypothetical protein
MTAAAPRNAVADLVVDSASRQRRRMRVIQAKPCSTTQGARLDGEADLGGLAANDLDGDGRRRDDAPGGIAAVGDGASCSAAT